MKFAGVSLLCIVGVLMARPAQGEKSWRSKMSDLSAALSETIPYLYPDPEKDVKGLGEKIDKVYEISRGLDVKFDHAQKVGDFDPALPYIASLFKEDIERARLSMKDGNVEYAKAVLRSSTAYCIACHTRTKGGAEFPLMKAFAVPLKGASWITKVEFLAASRQFDAVLSEVQGQLSSTGTPGVSSLDLERGARIALSIAIRAKKDLEKADFLARAMAKSPSATLSMKEAAKAWEKDLNDWHQEKKKKYASDEELIKAARELAARTTDKSALGGHNEVKYLRATSLMHDLLRQYPKSEFTTEALYIVGLSYGALQDLGLWSLQDMYFQACIDRSPHTKLSEKCFDEYEKSITLGYSGSSGTRIPGAVKKHLDQLKEKAKAL